MIVGMAICSAWATIAISAIPPGAVAIIIVAIGRSKAQLTLRATATEAEMMKTALTNAKGINSLCFAKNARS